jgi:hypothetical protein
MSETGAGGKGAEEKECKGGMAASEDVWVGLVFRHRYIH